jgi:hypothetical protein
MPHLRYSYWKNIAPSFPQKDNIHQKCLSPFVDNLWLSHAIFCSRAIPIHDFGNQLKAKVASKKWLAPFQKVPVPF